MSQHWLSLNEEAEGELWLSLDEDAEGEWGAGGMSSRELTAGWFIRPYTYARM